MRGVVAFLCVFSLLFTAVWLIPLWGDDAATRALSVPPDLAYAGADDDDDDDDDDDEDEDDEEDVDEPDEEPIPPPPSDHWQLPDDFPEEAKDEYDRAREAFSSAGRDKKKVQSAVALFEKLNTAHPDWALPSYYIGRLYTNLEKNEKAEAAYARALKLAPDFYDAHIGLGIIAAYQKKYKKSIGHLEDALETYEWSADALDWMTHNLIQLGRYEEANEYLKRALRHGSDGMRDYQARNLDLILNGPDWERTFTAETENYIVRTDISQETADELARIAELIRKVYVKSFPEIPHPDRKYLVLAHNEADTYKASGAPDGTAGYYVPYTRQLNLYRQGPLKDTAMVLKHEGFHQYCHEMLDNIPQWFNEGVADYFAASEEAQDRRGKPGLKIVPNWWRLESVAKAIQAKKLPSPKKLMLMSQREMYREEAKTLHYSMAWSLVYFCAEAHKGKYRKMLTRYFKALRKGKDRKAAYKASFGKISMPRFTQEWQDYMLDLNRKQGGRD